MSLPHLGPRQIVYEDRNHQVYKVSADFGRFAKEYVVSDFGQRAGVVVLWREAVLLVRQYRFLIDGVSWEIPGGRLDPGEKPEEAATRECLEETGVRCHNLRLLLRYQLGLDILHNPTHLFYTDEFVEAGDRPHHGSEVEEHRWVPLEQSIDMVLSEQIVDSFSVIALLAYRTSFMRG